MHEVARRTAVFAAATGGLLLAGVGSASAAAIMPAQSTAPGVSTTDASGLLSGNAVELPLSVPVNLCGINVLGDSSGTTACGASDSGGSGSLMTSTTGASGLLSGNAVQAPVSIPLNACGINVLGNSSSTDACTADVSAPGSASSVPTAVIVPSAAQPSDATTAIPVADLVPMDPPAADPQDPSGTLAQTGSDDVLPWSATGAGALMSGATLSAIAFKARSAAEQL